MVFACGDGVLAVTAPDNSCDAGSTAGYRVRQCSDPGSPPWVHIDRGDTVAGDTLLQRIDSVFAVDADGNIIRETENSPTRPCESRRAHSRG